MAHSFAQDQFGKPIDQITASDLIDYFATERDESLTLEFKSFSQHERDIKHKENGILRTICGFLNSTGGLLVWGAPVGSNNSAGQKVFTGELSPVEKLYTKDDFISRISNRIIPFAAPVKVERVKIEPDKYVYLIDVPESEAKPHQFGDVYYIRLDGQTKPAPHYIIDALFKQVKIPVLSGYLRIVGLEIGEFEGEFYSTKMSLNIQATIFNESRNINDKGLYIVFSAEKTKLKVGDEDNRFVGSDTILTNCQFLYDDSYVKITEPDRILTNSMPITYQLKVNFIYRDYAWLSDHRGGLSFSMIFGSTLSMTKKSEYTVKLSYRIGASPGKTQRYTDEKELNDLITVTKNENDYFTDYWDIEHVKNIMLPGI